MNHFCLVGIYSVLAMLMLMIMPSSIADQFKIKVKGDKKAIVYVKETDKVSTLKEKIAEKLKKDTNEETNGMYAKVKISNKTMHELKAKLAEKHYENTEILPARITLRLDKNDSPLEDSKTMKECGIAPEKSGNAYVYLTLDELKIIVEGDKKAIVYVKETDKVSTLKEKIAEKLRENINEEIEIIETELKEKEKKFMTFIRTNLKVSNKRIDELKAKLEEKKNEKNKILTARKTLRLDKNDSPLEDSKTMEEYGIVKKGATVFLALEGFEISIQYRGEKYTIWVNNEDTVYELKNKIQKVIGIHQSNQKLTFQAENDIVLEDNEKTMQFYNIGKGASLLLKRLFRIGCQYERKEYFPRVEETEKVSSVKEKVKKEIKEKSGIQLKNITLSYWGEELKDNAEIGSYGGINSRSAIVAVYESSAKP